MSSNTETLAQGTFACPICGQETPHHHPDDQVAAYQDDNLRNDGWVSVAHRSPRPDELWERVPEGTRTRLFLVRGHKIEVPNPDWHNVSYNAYQRVHEATGYEAEVAEWDRGYQLFRLLHWSGNARVDGSEGRHPVFIKPTHWRFVPAWGVQRNPLDAADRQAAIDAASARPAAVDTSSAPPEASPPSPYRCVKPQCPPDCSMCNHAIAPDDEPRLLIADLLNEFANDGHGATFEDGEHALVDRARKFLNSAVEAQHGELDPRSALQQARAMLRYVEAFNGQKFDSTFDSVDRRDLATALDNLQETAAMLLNMASRAAAQPEQEPDASPGVPEIRECNACEWRGPLSETCMLGAVGPLCPECRETTEAARPAGNDGRKDAAQTPREPT